MDINSFTRREVLLRLHEDLLTSEQERLNGVKGFSIDETAAAMRLAAREVAGDK